MSFKKAMNGVLCQSKREGTGQRDVMSVWTAVIINQRRSKLPQCGSTNRQYFMSEAEHKRGMILMTKQMAGTITHLKFQHRIYLEVNGRKICRYDADATYYEDGTFVIEDSKAKNYIDDLALVKIKLCEAIFNTTIRIPQRESGNRSKAVKKNTTLTTSEKEKL